MARVVEIRDWRLCGHGETGDYPKLGASVPGTVLDDAVSAGIIAPPDEGLAGLAGQWINHRPWTYSAVLDNAERESDRHYLKLDRLTSKSRIDINGACAGEFEPGINITVDVSSLVKPGENSINIFMRPIERKSDDSACAGTGFCGNIATPGLGRVFLKSVTDAQARDFFPQARPSGNGALVTCKINTDVFVSGRYVFNYHVLSGDEVIAAHAFIERLTASRVVRTHTFEMDAMKLWNPAGSGDAELYQIILTIERAGVRCDRVSSPLACLRRAFTRPQSAISALSYCPVINDVPIFIKGAVWRAAPLAKCDLESSLLLLAKGGVNLLRVVGGVECAEFYEICDKFGLMVWQTLPTASALDDASLARAEDACGSIIELLRGHPCLTFWGGDGCTYKGRPLEIHHPALWPMTNALELDIERGFLPISPFGPVTDSAIEWLGRGLCYDAAGPGRYLGPFDNPAYCMQDDAVLRSSVGIAAFQDEAEYERICAGMSDWPVTLDNPLWAVQPGGAELVSVFDEMQTYTGPATQSAFPRYRAFMRYLQGHVLGRMIESARKRESAGIIANSAIDGAVYGAALLDGMPRPAYYAMQSAFKDPLIIAALPKESYLPEEELSAQICVLSGENVVYTAQVQLIDIEGGVLAEEFYTFRSGQGDAGTFSAAMPTQSGTVILRLFLTADSKTVSQNEYLIAVTDSEYPLEPWLSMPEVPLRATKSWVNVKNNGAADEGYTSLVILNDSKYVAAGITLSCTCGDISFGMVSLLPKESLHYKIATDIGWDALQIEGLNIDVIKDESL